MQPKKREITKKNVSVPVLFLYFKSYLYKTLIYSVLSYIKITFSRFPLETPCGLMLYIGGERLPNRRLPSNVHAKIAKFSELPAMIA